MNPEVLELKKRREQECCARCVNYDPREGRCGKHDLFLDGKGKCGDFEADRVTKFEMRVKKEK